jgi:hypothetical protein
MENIMGHIVYMALIFCTSGAAAALNLGVMRESAGDMQMGREEINCMALDKSD